MLPLLARYPALAKVPRVSLGRFPTPLASLAPRASNLWIKRDDLCADPLGGNKVRALEFLLGAVKRGDSVVTVGSAGSTHALAVATYAASLGAGAYVGRWRQVMNAAAVDVSERVRRAAIAAPVFRTPVGAYVYAWSRRVRGAQWIAAGGSVPLGILGHVNAGLELCAQIDAGEMPAPARVVVPLGTGGTAAGLALAFAIAKPSIVVVGARVVPRIVARESRVRSLAGRTAALIEGYAGARVPRPRAGSIEVAGETYGGAYGRETLAGKRAAEWMRQSAAINLDATYSAKAFGHALELAERAPTLFWLTFDARALAQSMPDVVRSPIIRDS